MECFRLNYEKLIIEDGETYDYRGGDSERMLDSQQGKVKDSERPVTGGHQTGFLHYMRFSDAYKLHYYQVVNPKLMSSMNLEFLPRI